MILRWGSSGWVSGADADPDVIDSFRLTDGHVVALDLHERRFRAGCADRVHPTAVTDFLAAARARLPRTGDRFPRYELTDGRLQLRLRPCPPPGRTVAVAPVLDPGRRDPRTKGADLGVLAAARDAARQRGGDEALLVARDGRLLEGTTTSLVWWRDEQLCTVAAQDVLDGVTCRVLGRLAGGLTRVPAHLDDLAGCETWAVNALHGIRAVTHVVDGPRLGRPIRQPAWQARLRDAARPVRLVPHRRWSPGGPGGPVRSGAGR